MAHGHALVMNLVQVMEILRNGVRRADVFMGIGLNAAEANPPISHMLSPDNLHHIRLVKSDLTPQEKSHVASEFGKWIRANGLRELVETLSLFLDKLYVSIFVMHRGADKSGKKLERPDRLERLGVIDKIDTMSNVVRVSAEDKYLLHSLNRMRNCYAHRLGVVGDRDLDGNADVMTVRWNAFELQVQEPDGNIIPEAELYGHLLKKGGAIQLKVVERTRSFNRGAELVLEKRDLKEIGLSTLIIGRRIFHATVEQARELGVLRGPVDKNLNGPKAI